MMPKNAPNLKTKKGCQNKDDSLKFSSQKARILILEKHFIFCQNSCVVAMEILSSVDNDVS